MCIYMPMCYFPPFYNDRNLTKERKDNTNLGEYGSLGHYHFSKVNNTCSSVFWLELVLEMSRGRPSEQPLWLGLRVFHLFLSHGSIFSHFLLRPFLKLPQQYFLSSIFFAKRVPIFFPFSFTLKQVLGDRNSDLPSPPFLSLFWCRKSGG